MKADEVEKFLKGLRDASCNVTDGPVSGLFTGTSPYKMLPVRRPRISLDP